MIPGRRLRVLIPRLLLVVVVLPVRLLSLPLLLVPSLLPWESKINVRAFFSFDVGVRSTGDKKEL